MTHMTGRRRRSVRYNIAEAKARLSSVVREVLAGDEVVIAKDSKPLVKIVPLRGGGRVPGSARGQVTIAPDFDAPLEDFAAYR
jgi:prevent-host-death family protein